MHKETRRLFKHISVTTNTDWYGDTEFFTLNVHGMRVIVDVRNGYRVERLHNNIPTFVFDKFDGDLKNTKGLERHQKEQDVLLVRKVYEKALDTVEKSYAQLIDRVVGKYT